MVLVEDIVAAQGSVVLSPPVVAACAGMVSVHPDPALNTTVCTSGRA
jgi:hypothetical protein